MLNAKRFRFPVEIILQCVRWHVAPSFSDRQIVEMMAERGIQVDPSGLRRWAVSIPSANSHHLVRHRIWMGDVDPERTFQ
ncbi:IS6 family transposase [Chitinivorax sp. B]|uniref:IS6 family transposase n=1 Tax=Chitinivorax sp. B TaxID=2502235 RepID=UPI0010F6E02C|nr:IS6 family transposase [Chitinivorax sp. B]